jgi:hypothetical protein
MRLFFPPQLGVGVEDVAGALPGEVQPVQLAADGVFGEVQAGAARQVLLEQRDGPLGGEVAEVLGRAPQQLEQEGTVLLAQQAGPARATLVE